MEPQSKKTTPTDHELARLSAILAQYNDRRVVVVGTTCTGKSTMIDAFPGALDMDKLVFPQLTKAEAAYVCQTPWTPEIGRTMIRLVRERVKVEPGHPVFGTIVIDCDLLVVLKISDQLLKERTEKRGVDFADARNMQRQIVEQAGKSGIPYMEVSVG